MHRKQIKRIITGLSDFEINKKVAKSLNYETSIEDNSVYVLFRIAQFTQFPLDDFIEAELFDPCNNPSDAMPIIIENKICLTVGDSDDIWVADTTRSLESSFNASPLRAAMELFLLMKDAENEG